MTELLATSVKCDAKLHTAIMDTVIGPVTGSKEFRVSVTIEYVSSGDFSRFEAPSPEFQHVYNQQLEYAMQEYLIKHVVEI